MSERSKAESVGNPSLAMEATKTMQNWRTNAGGWLFRHLPAKLLIQLAQYIVSTEIGQRRFRLPHNSPIALAGTWCAPGIREGGGDLPPWKRFHGPEGARQAGMPGGRATAYRRWSAAEADGAPYVPDHWSISWPTVACARPKAATATGRGRRPEAFRRLTPGVRLGRQDHPH